MRKGARVDLENHNVVITEEMQKALLDKNKDFLDMDLFILKGILSCKSKQPTERIEKMISGVKLCLDVLIVEKPVENIV